MDMLAWSLFELACAVVCALGLAVLVWFESRVD